MCISPLIIKNPNAGAKKQGLNLLKDCTSAFIKVPCGHCPHCIALRQMEFIQRVLCESLFCDLFFGTFTYNDVTLPTFNVNGFNLHYASSKDFDDMIKRVRKVSAYPFRYFVVSEFGSKHGRPHFHLLLSSPKSDVSPLNKEEYFYKLFLKEWRRNYGSTRQPFYRDLCTFQRRFYDGRLSTNYDFHYINPLYSDNGVADVGFYVLKYMMKADKHEQRLQQALHLNLDKALYNIVWPIVKSKVLHSKGFGLADFGVRSQRGAFISSCYNKEVTSHIRRGIEFGKGRFDYPVFIHPLDGSTFPLSQYYKNYYLTADDAIIYYMENVGESPYLDSIHDEDEKALNQILSVIEKYRRRCDLVESKTFL